MGRGHAFAALAVAVLGACNALNGADELTLCDGDCPDGGAAQADASADAPDFVEAGPDGALPPGCKDGQVTCAGKTAAKCVMGSWIAQDCAEQCQTGTCVRYPSCRGEAADGCGTTASSCCESLAVPDAVFDRRNDMNLPAIVTGFSLDRFEVTVGRFRAFVAAGGATQANPPPAGAGADPRVPGSGWQSAWNAALPLTVSDLTTTLAQSGGTATWTPTPAANEHKPINDVGWLLAFAFCAWDGAHLPTYAEWEAAATGGIEQRFYPWSTPPTATNLDGPPVEAAYDCNFQPPSQVCSTTCSGCAGDGSDIAEVGVMPGGEAKWGHRDLGGNMGEWVLDVALPPSATCIDCACLYVGPVDRGSASCDSGGAKMRALQLFIVGGGWRDSGGGLQVSNNPPSRRWNEVRDDVGFRCAR